jgi:hypothetical protein
MTLSEKIIELTQQGIGVQIVPGPVALGKKSLRVWVKSVRGVADCSFTHDEVDKARSLDALLVPAIDKLVKMAQSDEDPLSPTRKS